MGISACLLRIKKVSALCGVSKMTIFSIKKELAMTQLKTPSKTNETHVIARYRDLPPILNTAVIKVINDKENLPKISSALYIHYFMK